MAARTIRKDQAPRSMSRWSLRRARQNGRSNGRHRERPIRRSGARPKIRPWRRRSTSRARPQSMGRSAHWRVEDRAPGENLGDAEHGHNAPGVGHVITQRYHTAHTHSVMRGLDPRVHDGRPRITALRKLNVFESPHGLPGQALHGVERSVRSLYPPNSPR